jgi:hypothetical protein
MTPAQAYETYGTKAAAARVLNMPVSTFKDQLKRGAAKTAAPVLQFPEIPDPRLPVDRLIDLGVERYNRKKAYREASNWQQIRINENKPYGIALIGDPHLDSDGCAWPALLDDIALLKSTPGLYAINIGDTTNNWVGRLARLFGDQEASQTTARQYAEWFLTKAGIQWAGVIIGNHDAWNEGGEILRRMCAAAPVTTPVHDWAAKIEFVTPNGATFRGSFAHDFKGRSIYSTTHGPLREAIWNADGAHLLAAGHIHFGGLQTIELPGGRVVNLCRVRGYKDDDHFALVNGFHEGHRFRSAVAIIDPNAPEHERCMLFPSIRQGAAVLRAMRGETGNERTYGAAHESKGGKSTRNRRSKSPSRDVGRKAGGRSVGRRGGKGTKR